MGVMVGPDGKPSTFDGGAWVSSDGKYWWNGAGWQPTARRQRPNFFVIGVGLLIAAAVGLVVLGVIKPGSPPAPPPVVMGVTNAKIDSSTQIELDYARQTDCQQLTFEFVFYDKSGHELARYSSDVRHDVTGGVSHHYRFATTDIIPAGAVRFDAIPTCRT